MKNARKNKFEVEISPVNETQIFSDYVNFINFYKDIKAVQECPKSLKMDFE